MARRLIFKEGGLTGSIPSGYQAIGFNGATFSQLTSAGAFSGGAAGTSGINGTSGTSAAGGGGLTRFTEGLSTSAPNATVNVVSLTATASTTNADISIVPKGTGAFTLAVPNGATTGGNKRGQYAVDLQTYRTNAANVASGDYSIVIGYDCRATNAFSVAIGTGCVSSGNGSTAFHQSSSSNVFSFAHGSRTTASGFSAVAFGSYTYGDTIASGGNSTALNGSNQATGDFSFAAGGYGNVAGGYMSYAFGTNGNTFGITGRMVKNYSFNSIYGECQKSIFNLGVRTTDGTATTATVGGGVAGNINQVILSNNSSYVFNGLIVGKQSGSTNACAFKIEGLITRGANAASTTLNSSTVTTISNTPTWGGPTLAADTTNGGLRIQVTGTASTNIQWTVVVETAEVVYA